MRPVDRGAQACFIKIFFNSKRWPAFINFYFWRHNADYLGPCIFNRNLAEELEGGAIGSTYCFLWGGEAKYEVLLLVKTQQFAYKPVNSTSSLQATGSTGQTVIACGSKTQVVYGDPSTSMPSYVTTI